MKKIVLILFLALGTHAASSGAFDLGSVFQQQEESKKKKSEQTTQQPAQQTTTQQPTTQSAGMSPMMMLGKTPVEDEVRIGRQGAGDLLGAAPLVKDDTLERYVDVPRILQMLAERYLRDYAIVVWTSEVLVIRGEKSS